MNVYRLAPPWVRADPPLRIIDMRTADRDALFVIDLANYRKRREEAREYGTDFREPPPVQLPPDPSPYSE